MSKIIIPEAEKIRLKKGKGIRADLPTGWAIHFKVLPSPKTWCDPILMLESRNRVNAKQEFDLLRRYQTEPKVKAIADHEYHAKMVSGPARLLCIEAAILQVESNP
jgi:hypothetical protein